MNFSKETRRNGFKKHLGIKIASSLITACTLFSSMAVTCNAAFDKSLVNDYEANIIGESSGACGDTASFTLSSGGILTISGSGAMTNFTSPGATPWYADRESIKTVIVQTGIESIGKDAFVGLPNLKNVTLGKSVVAIYKSAFIQCPSLIAIDVVKENTIYKSEDGVVYTKAGDILVCCPNGKSGAFTVPSTVTTIDENAFEICEKITEINIGDGVKTIGSNAFYGCSSLEKVTLGKSLETIGKNAFTYSDKLKAFEISANNPDFKVADGIIYSKDGKRLVCVPCGIKGEFTVSQGVESVDPYAAYRCTFITSIKMSNTVKTVGEYAFSYCEGVTFLVLGDNVETVDKSAFSNLIALVDLKLNNGLKTIANNGFYSCDVLKDVIIPDSVETIGRNAFQKCYKLTNLWLGRGVKKVDSYAFCHCPRLLNVTILSNVTEIKSKSFGYTQTGSSGYTYSKISGFSINGVVGSAAEAYATKEGFGFTEYEEGNGFFEPDEEVIVPTPDDITKLPENDFYMDADNKVMPNVIHKTSASAMIDELKKYGVDVSVTDKNGKSLTGTSLIGTGCVVTNAKTGEGFTVVVLGDIDGTGTIDGTDYLQIKMVFLDRLSVDGVYFSSADCDGDGNISATDYLRIKSFFLGTYDLYA